MKNLAYDRTMDTLYIVENAVTSFLQTHMYPPMIGDKLYYDIIDELGITIDMKAFEIESIIEDNEIKLIEMYFNQ
jgi:hypothetical protein